MRWGDRSKAFVCARNDGVLDQYGQHRRRIGFIYLKTTQDNAPARIEFPLWLLEDGQLEAVIDVIRAECIVGTGYPYPCETADAVAVITGADRDIVYQIFQEFAEREGLPLRYSRKAASKLSRRS
jgi:hypothetical protein